MKTHKRSLRKPRLKRLHYLHPVKGRFHIAPCKIIEASSNWLTILFLDENEKTLVKTLVLPLQLTFEEPYDERYDQWAVRAMRLDLPIPELPDAASGQASQGCQHPEHNILLCMGCVESFFLPFAEPMVQFARWFGYHDGEQPVDRNDALLQPEKQADAVSMM